MAEPLEQLLQHISRKRPHRRAEYQPAALLGDPGMRSQAMADAAQGVDISDAAPSTRLRAQRFDPDVYAQDEAPEPDDDGGDQPASPFQFASMTGEQPQASPVQYRKECGPSGCRMVPVFEEQQSFPSMSPAMSTVAPQLPPGVTLGPGETLVPGSVREGGSMPPRPAAAQPPVQAGPGAPPDVLAEVQRLYAPAIDAANSMMASVPGGTAMAAAAHRTNLNLHTLIGNEALKRQEAEKLRKVAEDAMAQNKTHIDKKLALAQEANDIKSGRMAMRIEDEIRKSPLPSKEKAARIVHERLKGLKGVVQLQPDDLGKMFDAEFGIVTANDVADLYEASQTAGEQLNKTAWSNPNHARLQASAYRLQGDIRQRAFDRFGKHQDLKSLRLAVEGELYPVIYKSRFDRLTGGENKMRDDEAHYRASVAASEFVEMVIGGVSDMQKGAAAHRVLNEWHQQSTGNAVPQAPKPAIPQAPAPKAQPAAEPQQQDTPMWSWSDALFGWGK